MQLVTKYERIYLIYVTFCSSSCWIRSSEQTHVLHFRLPSSSTFYSLFRLVSLSLFWPRLAVLPLRLGVSRTGGESSKVEPVFWSEVTVRSSGLLSSYSSVNQNNTRIENTWLASWITLMSSRASPCYFSPILGMCSCARGHLRRREVVDTNQFGPVCPPGDQHQPRPITVPPHRTGSDVPDPDSRS